MYNTYTCISVSLRTVFTMQACLVFLPEQSGAVQLVVTGVLGMEAPSGKKNKKFSDSSNMLMHNMDVLVGGRTSSTLMEIKNSLNSGYKMKWIVSIVGRIEETLYSTTAGQDVIFWFNSNGGKTI